MTSTSTVDSPVDKKRVNKKKLGRKIGGTIAVILIVTAILWDNLNDMRQFKQRKDAFVAAVQAGNWQILALDAPREPLWIIPRISFGKQEWRAQVVAGRCDLTVTAPEKHPERAVVNITSTTPVLAAPVSDLTSKKVAAINFYLNLGHCYAQPVSIGTP